MKNIPAAIFCFFLFLAKAAPAAAQAAGSCAALGSIVPPVASVHAGTAEPVYDLTRTDRYIKASGTRLVARWLKDSGLEALWKRDDFEIGSMAAGGWGMLADVEVDYEPVDKYGIYYCPYVRKANVEILYRPLILIDASYAGNGGCAQAAAKDHMLLHHTMTQKLLDAYARKMEKDLTAMVAEMTVGAVYTKKADLQESMELMRGGIQQTVDGYFRQAILKEAGKRTGMIDSPERIAETAKRISACAQEKGK